MLTLSIVASEPSKVPFYIMGAVLVVFAVALAGIGLTQPEFPGSTRNARALMALAAVLALATILAAILTDP